MAASERRVMPANCVVCGPPGWVCIPSRASISKEPACSKSRYMKIKKHKNGTYYAHLTGSNPVNLKTKNAGEAEKLAKAANLEQVEFAAKAQMLTAEAVVRLSAGSKVKFPKAVEAWKSWANTVGLSPVTVEKFGLCIDQFARAAKVSEKYVLQITEEDVDTFVNPKDSTIGSGTRNYRLSALNGFFDLCCARGYCLRSPAQPVRVKMHLLTQEQKEPKEMKTFTKTQLATLAQLEDPFWRAAVLLGYETGMRISDIATLEWASLVPNKNELIVWTDKHDKRIVMPISKTLRTMLTNLPKSDARFVFPDQARLMMDLKKRSTLSVYFSRILASKNIEGRSFHSLRHTFATERGQEGEPIDKIRERMGHSLAETTKGYIHAK
jgi:integrase